MVDTACRVVDGQHRLHACIESDYTMRATVRCISERGVMVVDTGVVRAAYIGAGVSKRMQTVMRAILVHGLLPESHTNASGRMNLRPAITPPLLERMVEAWGQQAEEVLGWPNAGERPNDGPVLSVFVRALIHGECADTLRECLTSMRGAQSAALTRDQLDVCLLLERKLKAARASGPKTDIGRYRIELTEAALFAALKGRKVVAIRISPPRWLLPGANIKGSVSAQSYTIKVSRRDSK